MSDTLSNDIVKLGVVKNEFITLENEVEKRIRNITNRIFSVMKGGHTDPYNEIDYNFNNGTVTVENYTTWSGGNDNRNSDYNPPITLSFKDLDSFNDEEYFKEYLIKLKGRFEAKKTTESRREARLKERRNRDATQATRDEMMEIAKTLGITPTDTQLQKLLSLRA